MAGQSPHFVLVIFLTAEHAEGAEVFFNSPSVLGTLSGETRRRKVTNTMRGDYR